MTAWRYEISLLVLKNISLVRAGFQHSKREFASPRGHVISSIYKKAIFNICAVLLFDKSGSFQTY